MNLTIFKVLPGMNHQNSFIMAVNPFKEQLQNKIVQEAFKEQLQNKIV
jgi:hypothetical protein